MRRLMDMRRQIDRRGRDRGAVVVIVAMVVGMFVLTGVAALTIDAGSLYAERRVVQNGADAASLALAQACARGDVANCSPFWSALTDLTDLNSPDGLTDIASICGSTALFTPCPTPWTDPSWSPALVDCTKLPPSLPAGVNYVEVRTKTRSITPNTSVVHKFFARNDAHPDGVSVKACARAAWGPAGGLTTFVPVTFSECEWKAGTVKGTIYGNKPPFTVANPETPAREIAIALNAPNDAACATWAGHDLPGGFGWLCHGSGCIPPSPAVCEMAVDGNGWVDADTGIGGGNDCKPQMNALVGKVAYLPVFDCISGSKTWCTNDGSGTNAWYHIKGYAAFYVTGVDIAGGMLNNFLPGYPTTAARQTCNAKGGKCIYGWFLEDLLPASAIIGVDSTDFGLEAVQVAG
jgi:Putative Flp pilus-assembly TadE/G-like